jgi:Icc protein
MLIAQISDVHLKPEGVLAYGVADTATPLARAVDHINRLNPRPDVVLATGDLVDEGSSDSYAYLTRLLSSLEPPLFIVPGNHDHKPSLYNALPGDDYLQQAVEEEGESYLCFSVEEYPLRLVGLDTVTPGEHGGGLGRARLEWLDRTLSSQPKRPTVVFMHHPPFPSGIGHMDKEVFSGCNDLAEIIGKHPQVERILCGHVHRSIFRRFSGTIASVCPGIGMQLVLDLRGEAPSMFILEPPAVMLHLWTDLWGEPSLLSHISVLEEHPGQYGGPHPFFGVISPR